MSLLEAPARRVTTPSSPGHHSESVPDDSAVVPFIKRDESHGAKIHLYDVPDINVLQPVVDIPTFDIPTFLIEHWFKSVCGSWSALDSQANPVPHSY